MWSTKGGPTLPISALILLIVEACLFLPAYVAGLDFLREEWEFLGRSRSSGAWNAADPATANLRPLVRAVYAAVYSVAETSRAIFLVPPLLAWAIAVSVVGALRPIIGIRLALGVAALWLLLPTHLTLDHWVAAVNVDLAVFLAVFGGGLLLRAKTSVRAVAAGVVMGLGVLLYEAVAPFAFLIVVIAMLLTRASGERSRLPVLAVGALLPFVVAAALLSVGPREKVFLSPLPSLYYNFGVLQPWYAAAAALMIVALSGLLLAVVRLTKGSTLRPWHTARGELMTVSGFAVWFVGYLPFSLSNYDAMFLGVGDRGNCVSALGVALAFVGLFDIIHKWSRSIAVVLGVLVTSSLGLVHLDRSVEWAQVTNDVRALGDCLIEQSDGRPIVLRSGSGLITKALLSADASTELALYLDFGVKQDHTVQMVPFDSPTAAFSPAPFLNGERSLEELGCASNGTH